MVKKKRTSLESFLVEDPNTQEVNRNTENVISTKAKSKFLNPESDKPEIVRQTVYMPSEVYEQLRTLAFQERRKMHDYLMEGLELVFEKRGLKSIENLSNK